MQSSRPRAPLLLLVLSGALILLALFQWVELMVVRSGGHTVCSINATVNCERVWDSDFAARVHALSRVPVAGWGLIYALMAFVLSALLWREPRAERQTPLVAAVQWAAVAGMFSCVLLAFASARAGAVCLTCMGTYALVFGYASVAFLLLPNQLVPVTRETSRGLLWAGGLTLAGYLLVLYPGLRTPHVQSQPLAAASSLQSMVTRLSEQDQQLLSDATAEYQRSAAASPHAPRMQVGPRDAPVHVVEFTDILCPHCRHFTESLEQVRALVPPNTLSVEPRQYPLDADCNPFVPRSDHSGTRCLAAKALICLESSPTYEKASAALFENQNDLNPDRVRVLLNEQGVDVPALDACMASPETVAKLTDDEKYAQEMGIRGTPLVLVNGHETFPAPVFLYALILAKGDIHQLTALSLPPPRESH